MLAADQRRKQPLKVPRPGASNTPEPGLTGSPNTGLKARGHLGMLAAAEAMNMVKRNG